MSDSTQHTPGKLEQHGVWIFTDVADSAAIAKLEYGGVDSPGFAAAKANARRLVAAWNACEGIDTEVLENLLLMGDTFKSRFAARDKAEDELAAEVAALKAQRDELVGALKALRDEAVDVWDYPQDYAQIENADEVLAKHAGSAS